MMKWGVGAGGNGRSMLTYRGTTVLYAVTRRIGDKHAGMAKGVVWAQRGGAQGDLTGQRGAVGQQGSVQHGRSGIEQGWDNTIAHILAPTHCQIRAQLIYLEK